MEKYNKHPSFIVKEGEPFNGEPPLSSLLQSFVTPVPLFFARNHGTVPEVEPQAYRLSITGMVEKPLSLSLDDLRNHFPRQAVTATLQCAGNRRSELMAVEPIPGEVAWDAAAISTAVWSGFPLQEILQEAGVQPGAKHIAFTGLDEVHRHGQSFGFGGSIPLSKAESSEVLLADEINGETLTPVHGFPLRLVVPGYIGARSVKWISEISVQSTPSDNYFYTRAYQLFSPQMRAESVDWERGIKLGELPINSVICNPGPGAQVATNPVMVQGYAISSGGRSIERVDVSADGGENWVTARLSGENAQWAWRLWEASLELRPGSNQIIARAWDSAANTQPEEVKSIWNFKGYMNNAWHRVSVHFPG